MATPPSEASSLIDALEEPLAPESSSTPEATDTPPRSAPTIIYWLPYHPIDPPARESNWAWNTIRSAPTATSSPFAHIGSISIAHALDSIMTTRDPHWVWASILSVRSTMSSPFLPLIRSDSRRQDLYFMVRARETNLAWEAIHMPPWFAANSAQHWLPHQFMNIVFDMGGCVAQVAYHASRFNHSRNYVRVFQRFEALRGPLMLLSHMCVFAMSSEQTPLGYALRRRLADLRRRADRWGRLAEGVCRFYHTYIERRVRRMQRSGNDAHNAEAAAWADGYVCPAITFYQRLGIKVEEMARDVYRGEIGNSSLAHRFDDDLLLTLEGLNRANNDEATTGDWEFDQAVEPFLGPAYLSGEIGLYMFDATDPNWDSDEDTSTEIPTGDTDDARHGSGSGSGSGPDSNSNSNSQPDAREDEHGLDQSLSPAQLLNLLVNGTLGGERRASFVRLTGAAWDALLRGFWTLDLEAAADGFDIQGIIFAMMVNLLRFRQAKKPPARYPGEFISPLLTMYDTLEQACAYMTSTMYSFEDDAVEVDDVVWARMRLWVDCGVSWSESIQDTINRARDVDVRMRTWDRRRGEAEQSTRQECVRLAFQLGSILWNIETCYEIMTVELVCLWEDLQPALQSQRGPAQRVESVMDVFVSGLKRPCAEELADMGNCSICQVPLVADTNEETEEGEAEDVWEVVRLPCHTAHVFHKQCIVGWFEMNQTCPFDRVVLFEDPYSWEADMIPHEMMQQAYGPGFHRG